MNEETRSDELANLSRSLVSPPSPELQSRVERIILDNISKQRPISAVIIKQVYLPLEEIELPQISSILHRQAQQGGGLFYSNYTRKPHLGVDGSIYSIYTPSDYEDVPIKPEEEIEEDPFDTVELPPEITSELFNVGDSLSTYLVPSAKRVVFCKSEVDPAFLGDDASLCSEFNLGSDFKIDCPSSYLDSAKIMDVHLAILKSPENQGRFLALMNDPVLEDIEGRTLRISVDVVRRAGWEIGETVYIYVNPSVRELLLVASDNLIYFTPENSYKVRSDGSIHIPMRYLYEVDIHEGYHIRDGSLSIGSVIICPDDQYHQQVYVETPIERVGESRDFTEDEIPF